MSFITDTHLKVKQQLAKFDNCSKEEQAMMLVLAVVYKPVTQTQLNQILASLADNGAFASSGLKMSKTERSRLSAKELIDDNHNGIRLTIYLRHTLMIKCVESGSLQWIVQRVNQIIPVGRHHSWSYRESIDRQAVIRQMLYLSEFENCEAEFEFDKDPQFIVLDFADCLIDFCFYPFDQDFFVALSPTLQYQIFAILLLRMREDFKENSEVVKLLQSLYDQGFCTTYMPLLLAEEYLLRGELEKVRPLLSHTPDSAYALALSGWLYFLLGDNPAALSSFDQSLIAKNKIARRTRQFVSELPSVFYLLALLKGGYEGQPQLFARLHTQISNYNANQRAGSLFEECYEVIGNLAKVLSNKMQKLYQVELSGYRYDDSYYFRLGVLLSGLCRLWAGKKLSQDFLKKLKNCAEQSLKCGGLWYTDVAYRVLRECGVQDMKDAAVMARHDKHQVHGIDMLTLIKKKADWLQALDQLISLKTPSEADEAAFIAVNQSRLVWLLHPYHPYQIEPKEQKMGKKGWTKGRAVSLKRLRDNQEEFDFLTPEDIKLCDAIDKALQYGYYRESFDYKLNGYRALKAGIDHPRLFTFKDLNNPIEIIEGQPELMITESGNGYKIHLPSLPTIIDTDYDDKKSQPRFSLLEQSATRYVFIPFTGQHLEIANIVGAKGLEIPKEAKEKVLQSIAVIAPLLNIQSDIQGLGDVNTGVEEVEPDQTLYINIQPVGQGLQMECHVQPLGANGPQLLPGSGNSMVVAQVDGKRIMTHRLLAVEEQYQQKLLLLCPSFNYMIDHVLLLDDLEEALNCLEQLEMLQHRSGEDGEARSGDSSGDSSGESQDEPPVVLLWPKGKELKLSKPLGGQQMDMTVGKQKDWFSLEGELKVGDGEVMDLKNLLTLMENSPGRFVRLEDNKFLALTEQLRQQLRDISALAFNGKFHPLAAPLIDEATQGMTVKSNQVWRQQLKRLKESFALSPQLPSTLQADLRDYQLDGFDWAARLAHWGGGACLADDMGLGKTLQALAVILSRTAQGPALVLAPTSVCFNWQDESHKFAPTLKVKMFGAGSKKERQAMLEQAQPFDLIICSYGLLQTEGEHLTNVDWHTIVADEAQAIKNPQARRTQVAMSLKGDFKMITTGTPIENNLTELWSLFRFINPGLLGSKKEFQSRFVNTIENSDKDEGLRKEASQALRRMISPFILRRLKTDVLTELPSRTEINLHVELSQEESAFYEALRQKAVENLLKTDDKPGQKRIKILAEIMRLRRACCHPALVTEETLIEGSKLKVFDNLVDELRQGNHRALVFSQFVGHLSILREHLTEKGIHFQYLDGSTTPANRKKAVNAFQSGEGDLFLISLKAGGAGLNLTAADYVIHMDPWWNPAVEDQASDRAHRMGQTRPVTIYRLITQNTIEDKIVALHQQKRDLANSLLEGTDSSGNLSLDDMMNLLQEEM